MAASFVGPWIDCRMLSAKRLGFTASWTAVALTDGEFYVEGTDDPCAARASDAALDSGRQGGVLVSVAIGGRLHPGYRRRSFVARTHRRRACVAGHTRRATGPQRDGVQRTALR